MFVELIPKSAKFFELKTFRYQLISKNYLRECFFPDNFLLINDCARVCVSAEIERNFSSALLLFYSRTSNQQNSESEKLIAFTRFSTSVYIRVRFPIRGTHTRRLWVYKGKFFPFEVSWMNFMSSTSAVLKDEDNVSFEMCRRIKFWSKFEKI